MFAHIALHYNTMQDTEVEFYVTNAVKCSETNSDAFERKDETKYNYSTFGTPLVQLD